MAKNNTNNVEILNEFVEALKFVRTKRPYTYVGFVEGSTSLVVEYSSTLGRFVFTGYYNRNVNRKVNCMNCAGVYCEVHKYIENRYLV